VLHLADKIKHKNPQHVFLVLHQFFTELIETDMEDHQESVLTYITGVLESLAKPDKEEIASFDTMHQKKFLGRSSLPEKLMKQQGVELMQAYMDTYDVLGVSDILITLKVWLNGYFEILPRFHTDYKPVENKLFTLEHCARHAALYSL